MGGLFAFVAKELLDVIIVWFENFILLILVQILVLKSLNYLLPSEVAHQQSNRQIFGVSLGFALVFVSCKVWKEILNNRFWIMEQRRRIFFVRGQWWAIVECFLAVYYRWLLTVLHRFWSMQLKVNSLADMARVDVWNALLMYYSRFLVTLLR